MIFPGLSPIVRLTSWGITESAVVETLWNSEADFLLKAGIEPMGTYTRMGGGVEIALGVRNPDSSADQADTDPVRIGLAVAEALGGATVSAASLPEILGSLARLTRLNLAVAESLTGGALGAAIAGVPGCSDYFLGGVTVYSNELKKSLLMVPAGVLDSHGAVSEECARAMAKGMAALCGAATAGGCDIAVSCTGIAGPGGATECKPVGLVYIGMASGGETMATRHQFAGNRDAVIARTVNFCLLHALGVMMSSLPGYREKALIALATGFSEGLGFIG